VDIHIIGEALVAVEHLPVALTWKESKHAKEEKVNGEGGRLRGGGDPKSHLRAQMLV
jgi:hypothetical protein